MSRGRRTQLIALVVVVALFGATSAAYAYFTANNTGNGAASADTVNTGATPTGSASGSTVTLNWAASTTAVRAAAVSGYVITRYTAASGGTGAAAGGTCTGTVAALTCNDSGLANGTYFYTVTPKLGNWLGTESARSTGILVGQTATKLVFTTQPVGNVTEGANFTTSPVVKVEDASNNVVTTDTGNITLAINSGPAAGSLTCSNAGFPTVAAVAGVATFTNCQITGTAAAGTYTLVATRSGLTSTGASSNVVINAGAANKLAFTSAPVAGPQATTTTLGPLTVEVQDSFGNPVTGARTVNLSSTGSPKFATTQNVAGATSLALSISAGSSSGSFFYGNNTAGAATITATSTSPTTITQTTQQATIGANKLVITSTAVSGTASNIATLGPITVQLQNVAGTPINAASNITVNLASNSTGTKRFAATSGGTSITSVTINSGTSTATFFYGDTLAGTPTITVSASGLTSGTQQETIAAGAAGALLFTNCSANGNPAGSCGGSGVAVGNNGFMDGFVSVTDAFGNVATTTAGQTWNITISSDDSMFVVTNSPVAITGPATQSSTTFHVKYNGSGNANATLTAHATSGSTAVIDATMTVKK